MENSNSEKNVFEKLKDIRQQKEISLESISQTSRIQLKYIQALEEGNLLNIPEVYDKLFFRSYLKTLEVDEEDYFEEFLKYRQKVRIDKTTSIIEFTSPSKEQEGKIFTHRNLFVVLPFTLIVILVAILLINTEMIGTSSDGKVQEIDIKNVVQRLEAEEKAKLDSVILSEQSDSTLSLKVKAIKKTWFRVIADKSDTNEFLLTSGQNIDIVAQNMFEFLIGRADGLQMVLNGEKLDAVGTDNTVVLYMLIDSSGIVTKRLKSDQP
jgi:transcriptional regulator with XRE-family HTH domain